MLLLQFLYQSFQFGIRIEPRLVTPIIPFEFVF